MTEKMTMHNPESIQTIRHATRAWRRPCLLAALLATLAGPCLAQTTPAAADAAAAKAPSGPPLTSLKDKMSYATGVITARQLMKNDVPFDFDMMVQGLRDGMAGGEIRMSEKELRIVLQSMQADLAKKLSNERLVKAGQNRERGIAFQNEYAKKPGVVILPGNLMYRVIKEGNGDKPNPLGTVVVKYRGTLVDGTEFDATAEGKTATLKLTDVITGWRETLKLMPAGSTWEIVVPTAMAYSTRGSGSIGPNETLVFTIELVAVVR
jgi:FKBP-type peptidyl-prolyl cis-trans isomerase FklB